MKHIIIIISFLFIYSNLGACMQDNRPLPVTANEQLNAMTPSVPSISGFRAVQQKEKAVLTWTVEQNAAADYFEVEKTIDGIHYTSAGMVFASEKQGSEKYPFKESCSNSQTKYRIRIITRNKEVILSETIGLSNEN